MGIYGVVYTCLFVWRHSFLANAGGHGTKGSKATVGLAYGPNKPQSEISIAFVFAVLSISRTDSPRPYGPHARLEKLSRRS